MRQNAQRALITSPLGISAIHENAGENLSFTTADLKNDSKFLKKTSVSDQKYTWIGWPIQGSPSIKDLTPK